VISATLASTDFFARYVEAKSGFLHILKNLAADHAAFLAIEEAAQAPCVSNAITLVILYRMNAHCAHSRKLITLRRIRLATSRIGPIKILLEFPFNFLSTIEFRPRLLNVRIARKSFQQNQRLLVGHLFLVFASDSERCSKPV
jgi:hypothetical protein